jgi:glycosyltransferase
MKISIITATFNSASTISRCISSVNTQTYFNIEHIIVDGGSIDNTLEIINSLPSRVYKTISEKDKGIYDALNKGIHSSSGDIIGFLHSDDIFASKSTIQNIASAFQNSEIEGVFGDLFFVNDEDRIVRTWKCKPFKWKNIVNGWMPPHPTLFFKKEVYEKYGLFDSTFKIAGDYDFMLRVMKDNEINLVYLPEVITKMRIGGASTGGSKNIILKMTEDVRALRNNGFNWPLLVVAFKNLRKLPQLLIR